MKKMYILYRVRFYKEGVFMGRLKKILPNDNFDIKAVEKLKVLDREET
jgi:hypothetical protein